jgi:hypothetical protein
MHQLPAGVFRHYSNAFDAADWRHASPFAAPHVQFRVIQAERPYLDQDLVLPGPRPRLLLFGEDFGTAELTANDSAHKNSWFGL